MLMKYSFLEQLNLLYQLSKLTKKISTGKPGFLTLKLRKELIEFLFTKENEFTEKVYDEKTIRTIGNEKI